MRTLYEPEGLLCTPFAPDVLSLRSDVLAVLLRSSPPEVDGTVVRAVAVNMVDERFSVRVR